MCLPNSITTLYPLNVIILIGPLLRHRMWLECYFNKTPLISLIQLAFVELLLCARHRSRGWDPNSEPVINTPCPPELTLLRAVGRDNIMSIKKAVRLGSVRTSHVHPLKTSMLLQNHTINTKGQMKRKGRNLINLTQF